MRAEIATEAGNLAGWPAAQVADLVRRVATSPLPVLAALEREGLGPVVVVEAAATVTGLPPAPRVLLRQPVIPAVLDAMGIRDAGGTPLGVVQGRLHVAFSDPEAARAAIFSDDVVVCLATDHELKEARERFQQAHPFSAGFATVALGAVTRAELEAFARQRGVVLTPPTARHAAASVRDETHPPSRTDSGIDPFDEATEHMAARQTTGFSRQATVITAPRRTLSDAPSGTPTGPPTAVAADARLAHLAQLGRLKRFAFERLLGSGGMATVYLAVDREVPGPPLAVKILLPHLRDNPVAVGRFRREVRTLMALRHRHIVGLVDGDAEADGGVLWLACRFLDGGTLRDLLRRTGPLPLVAALPIVAALLEAEAHAHASGVIHRDLKPQNILLGSDGSLCVADFGVAAAVGEEPLTTAGARFGTPAYMSPEQALGQPVDARTDLFATGVILHELLSGQNPFVRASPNETMRAIARGEVAALSVPLPPKVRGLLAALLSVPRDARPPHAAAALEAMRPWCADCPTVDEVVRRLLADPRAFDGAPPPPSLAPDTGVADTSFLTGTTGDIESIAVGFDDGASTAHAPQAGTALQAVRAEAHSAFGDVVGARATVDIAVVAVNGFTSAPPTSTPLDRPAPEQPSLTTLPLPKPEASPTSQRTLGVVALAVAATVFVAVVVAVMLWARS